MDLIYFGMYANHTPVKDIFQQGLPVEYSMGPIRNDPDAYNEINCRAFPMKYDNSGGSDALQVWPPPENAECSGLLPIYGIQEKPGIYDWYLFGAAKTICMNSTPTTPTCDTTDELLLLGTQWQIVHSATSKLGQTPFTRDWYLWTQEDTWVLTDLFIDEASGSEVADAIIAGAGIEDHIYFPTLFLAAKATDLRFMDRRRMGFGMYVPCSDVLMRHAAALSQIFGVPGLLR